MSAADCSSAVNPARSVTRAKSVHNCATRLRIGIGPRGDAADLIERALMSSRSIKPSYAGSLDALSAPACGLPAGTSSAIASNPTAAAAPIAIASGCR